MKIKSNAVKIVAVVLLDLIILASSLLTFAWFHHVKPTEFNHTVGLQTPIPVLEASPLPTAEITLSPVDTPVDTPVPSPDFTPEPVYTGLLGRKFREKFTDGEVIYTDDLYRSENVCIEMSRIQTEISGYLVTYYVADIYIQDISMFRTEVAQTDNNRERVVDMANRNNAIVAVSGDYFMFKKKGLAIRNGVLYRDRLASYQDVCVLYYDGTMETFYKDEVNLEQIMAKYPYQAWSFGPKLLDNGQPKTEFNCDAVVNGRNPRCAIGYYEPGHYCFVLVDGRQSGYSYGINMEDLSTLMYNLGCNDAYNLDGGMTAMMSYNGELRSKPCGGGRQNCDILYIRDQVDDEGDNQ